MQTRVKFVPNMSRWVVQVREDNQWFWRTCRMGCEEGELNLWGGNPPIYFLTKSEAMEYIEKVND